MNVLRINGEVHPGRASGLLTAPGSELWVAGTGVDCGYDGHGMVWSQRVADRCPRGVYAAIFDNSRRLLIAHTINQTLFLSPLNCIKHAPRTVAGEELQSACICIPHHCNIIYAFQAP